MVPDGTGKVCWSVFVVLAKHVIMYVVAGRGLHSLERLGALLQSTPEQLAYSISPARLLSAATALVNQVVGPFRMFE